MVKISNLLMKTDLLVDMEDPEKLVEFFSKGKTFQETVGLSDETLAKYYLAAERLMEKKQWEEAVDAFTFLTTLNQYKADFWVGLGRANQMTGREKSAISCYVIALSLAPERFDIYLRIARACVSMKDFDQAVGIMDEAILHAEGHPEESWSEDLKQEALLAKASILEKKR